MGNLSKVSSEAGYVFCSALSVMLCVGHNCTPCLAWSAEDHCVHMAHVASMWHRITLQNYVLCYRIRILYVKCVWYSCIFLCLFSHELLWVCVYIFKHVCGCTCVHVKPYKIGVGNHAQFLFHFVHWVRLSELKERADVASPVSHIASGTSCLCLPKLELQVDCHIHPAFMWVLGVQTLVLMFLWQQLWPLNHLPCTHTQV